MRRMLVAVLSMVALAGCSSGPQAAENSAPRVAIVLGGLANDGGFNQSGASAVKAMEKEGLATAQVRESVTAAADAESVVRQYAQDGYSLVIGWSDSSAEAIYRVAKEFPNVRFLVVDNTALTQHRTSANVEAWTYDSLQFGYLLGWIAGHAKLSPIGVVDGVQDATLDKEWKGFAQGVHAVNAGAEVRPTVYIGDWEDAQKANLATIGQLDSGAKLIATNAEGYASGVASAAASRDIAAVGMATTTSDATKKINIGRVALKMDPILREVLAKLKNGTFGDKTEVSTIANGSLVLDGIQKIPAAAALPAPDSLNSDAAQLAQQLASGKITITP